MRASLPWIASKGYSSGESRAGTAQSSIPLDVNVETFDDFGDKRAPQQSGKLSKYDRKHLLFMKGNNGVKGCMNALHGGVERSSGKGRLYFHMNGMGDSVINLICVSRDLLLAGSGCGMTTCQ